MSDYRGFASMWLLLTVSYVLVKVAYDQLVFGYLDVRAYSLLQLVILPAAQAVVFWGVTRRLRQSRGSDR